MKKVKIHIGEIYVSNEPAVVQTLLGSCVSVCLYDRVNRIGGMNHILLPGRTDLSHFDGGARYGINAMELLLNEFVKMGSSRRFLDAKIFGGAHILQNIDLYNSPGRQNVAFVREFLQMEQIPMVSCNVGGCNPRRVSFHTDSGDVYVKSLPVLLMKATLNSEERYSRRIQEEIVRPGTVDLFR